MILKILIFILAVGFSIVIVVDELAIWQRSKRHDKKQ